MAHWMIISWCAAVLFGASTVCAQVIQLPVYRVFSVGTTVSVPDSGGAFLGGVDRAAYGSNSVGVPGLSKLPGAGRLFANRGIGSDVSSSRAQVTATIIDLQEWDRAILEEAAARRGRRALEPAIEKKAAFLSQHIARPDASVAARPIPEAAVSSTRELPPLTGPRQVEANARNAFRLGQQAETAGLLSAARTNYQRAMVMGNYQLRAQAQARLAAINQSGSAITFDRK